MKKVMLYAFLSANLILAAISPVPATEPKAMKSPERIALLFPQAFGIFFILGIANRAVALPSKHTGTNNIEKSQFFRAISPEISSALDLGQPTSPAIETILKAGPDLILISAATEHSNNSYETLKKHGLNLVSLKAGFGTVEEWLQTVDHLAELTGTTQRAQRYRDYFSEKLKLIETRLAGLSDEQRPSVALLNTVGTQMVIRGSRTSFGYNLIRLAGGRLMNAGNDPETSAGCAELMFAYDPDIIIDDAKIDVFYKADWWKELRAVKTGRVFKTPADDQQAWVTNWFLPAYSPVGILWLAKILHPDKFADIDLKKEHEAFCVMLYGQTFSHSGDGFLSTR